MNRGEIPGFYFDEEKKKYFRIQDNHVAPPNAKYSRANVDREQKASRKRKLAQEQLVVQQQQTVTRAPGARHPLLAACGLHREAGTLEREHAYLNGARGPAILDQLEASSIDVDFLNFGGAPKSEMRLIDAQYLPNSGRFVLTCNPTPQDYFLLGVDCDMDIRERGRCDIYQHFTSEVISVTAYPYFGAGSPDLVASCDRSGVVSIFPALDSHPQVRLPWVRMEFPYTIWDSKVQRDTHKMAFMGTGVAFVVDLATADSICHSLPIDDEAEAFSMDWLNPVTIASGVTFEDEHNVLLWDIRARDASERIDRKFRITGIHVPNANRNDLIVTSARDISLYDLRYLDPKAPPLVSIPHTANGPALEFSVLDSKLVAAVDQFGCIQTYSLSSGRKLRSLVALAGASAGDPIRNPRWTEDERGAPFLQACHRRSILRWGWQGDDVAV